jgi:hypothetical protein
MLFIGGGRPRKLEEYFACHVKQWLSRAPKCGPVPRETVGGNMETAQQVSARFTEGAGFRPGRETGGRAAARRG